MRTGIGSAFFAAIALVAAATAAAQEDAALLWSQATLYRDEWGVPHVYADNPRALAFAFGYAQAEDHLEAMLMAYRVANGRAAEVWGEPYAESDEFSLKMGHAQLAAEAFDAADELTRDLCEGFAWGVNAWIVAHPDRVPPWAAGVRPSDALALMHCYLMSMAPFDLPEGYRRPAASFTGNAWAIAPDQTTDGNTLLVINPHGYYDGPFRWYEAHVVCHAMGLNVSGATLFGLPVILQGHNDVLGWALTPNQPDFADVYVEPGLQPAANPKVIGGKKLDEEQLMYLAMVAQSKPYYVLTPGGVVERGVPCVSTARGPVVGRFRGRLCSYQVGGYHDFGALLQCIEMGRAQTLPDFQAALAMHQLPCFHVVYADRDGNVYYVYNVKAGDKATLQRTIPPGEERTPGTTLVDWRSPRPVENPVYAWGDVIPEEALPSVLNPESGFVQACGNPPWTATINSGVAPDQWPPWFAGDRDTFRAQRVRHLLSMGPRSFVDCQSMLYDVLIPFATNAVPQLLETAEARPGFVSRAHPDLVSCLTLLREWNFVADAGAPAMTFFHAWWTALRALDPKGLPDDEALFAALWEDSPAIQDLSLQAAAQAARNLRNEYNAPSVPWGEVHVIRRGDLVEPISGSTTGEPIFTASDTFYDNGVWPVTYGYGFAMAVEFAGRPRAVSMVPFGSSENPQSPHFADQLDLMIGRRFKVTRFQDEDVQRYARSARGKMIRLRPEGMLAVFDLAASHPVEARLYVSAEPPAPLPEGMATFSVYVGPEYVPRDVPIQLDIDVTIPDTVCAPENVPALAVYAYDRQEKWEALATEQDEGDARTMFAGDVEARVYAVLGPAAYRLSTAPPPTAPPDAAPQGGGNVDSGQSVTEREGGRTRPPETRVQIPAAEEREGGRTRPPETRVQVPPTGEREGGRPRAPETPREPQKLVLRDTRGTPAPPAEPLQGPVPPLTPREGRAGSFVPGVGFVDSPTEQDASAKRSRRRASRTAPSSGGPRETTSRISGEGQETPSESKHVRKNFTHR